MRQKIEGSGNIQAGGDIHLHSVPADEYFGDPATNPNLTNCPVCTRVVSITAQQCPTCYDNLALRRAVLAERVGRRRMLILCIGSGGIAYALFQIGQFFPANAAGFSLAAGFFGLLAMAAIGKT